MNILYIASFPPPQLIKESRGQIDSLYRDDQALISGFRALENVIIDVITSPDIASFPQNNIFYKGFYDNESQSQMVSSLNISIIKQFWTIISMTRAARRIIKKCKNNTIVVIPYIDLRFTTVGRLLQLFFKNIKVAIIVPDIYFPKRLSHQIVNKIAERQVRKFNYYVLYTAAMAAHLKVQNKPQVIIEGFHEVVNHPMIANEKPFIVTYAGSLNLRYGIGRLLDAMSLIIQQDIELHLYGDGDAVELIKEKANKDNRIKYFGKVSKFEANEALFRASVLVNPRNSTDGDFVQYSFPSKDIDYLASGIPSILCKLPGMPMDYWGFFIDAGNGSPNELAQRIVQVYNTGLKERRCFGDKAKSFITQRMNVKEQARKIVTSFINC